jgi:hypothetical protein
VAVPVATAALVLILIGMLVWGPMQPVSAKEVVQRAIKADETRLKITPRQVVRQRVRVTKKPRLASGAQTARLESWKSTKFTYWETGGDALNAELLDRYKKSHISCDIPLSPRALESWMRIAGSEPSASRSGGRIEVNVASNSDARAHGLEDVSFRVESRGWHLDEMTLSFADATFQINEEQSSILDRREVPSDVLARLEPKHAVAAPVPVSGTPRTATSPVNLGDTEMAVRYELHQAGADLGENIEITPHASSQQLVVNAWAVSPERKEQLVALLGNKHGIQLKLQAPG